jgi:hypothetical protein
MRHAITTSKEFSTVFAATSGLSQYSHVVRAQISPSEAQEKQ